MGDLGGSGYQLGNGVGAGVTEGLAAHIETIEIAGGANADESASPGASSGAAGGGDAGRARQQ